MLTILYGVQFCSNALTQMNALSFADDVTAFAALLSRFLSCLIKMKVTFYYREKTTLPHPVFVIYILLICGN